MEFILKNSYMCVTISSLGAQLIKLVDKDNVSRLHDPSPISWNEVSPILFPMISRFPDKNINTIIKNIALEHMDLHVLKNLN